jgi:hypothetical protein
MSAHFVMVAARFGGCDWAKTGGVDKSVTMSPAMIRVRIPYSK